MNETLLLQPAPKEKEWVKLELVNNLKRYSPALAIVNDELYAVGGVLNGGWVNYIYHYNKTTKTLESKFGSATVSSQPVAFTLDNNALGYYTGGNIWTWYRWDISPGNTSTPFSSGSILAIAVPISYDNVPGDISTRKNYLMNVNGSSNVYQIVGNTVSKVGNNILHSGGYCACQANGKAYTFGGYAGGSIIKLASEYNLSTGVAIALTPMPVATMRACAITIDSDTIHVIGGAISINDTPTDIIQEYKISTNTWSVLTKKFPVTLDMAGYVQDSKAAYIVGNYGKAVCEIYKYEF